MQRPLSSSLALILSLVCYISSPSAAAISLSIHHPPPPQSVICESCLSGLHLGNGKGALSVKTQGSLSHFVHAFWD